MALGPYEAGLSPSQRSLADVIEQDIDRQLMDGWTMNQQFMCVSAVVRQNIAEPVRRALAERYRRAGWGKTQFIPREDEDGYILELSRE
jgi:hypothetical protein